jgi:U4/U6 small nuclear ribonucleoprotein PRP4
MSDIVVDLSHLGSKPPAIGADAIARAVASGNINIHDVAHTQVMELSKESRTEQEKHAEALRKVEALSRGRMMSVPALASDVSAALRKLGQPIKLYAESPADTRERLRNHLAQLEMEGEDDALGVRAAAEQAAAAAAAQRARLGAPHETVYTTAAEELVAARRVIAAFSFAQASQRLAGVKRRRAEAAAAATTAKEDPAVTAAAAAAAVCACACKLVINVSAVGDQRPLTAVRVSPCGSLVASGALSGVVKLWQLNTLRPRGTAAGHTERVCSLAWHPRAGLQAGASLLATASADKTVRLWNTAAASNSSSSSSSSSDAQAVCTAVLKGHVDRLARVEFHPSGRYVGSAAYDKTWRLWDVETGTELLLQDGHDKEVYAIAFQGMFHLHHDTQIVPYSVKFCSPLSVAVDNLLLSDNSNAEVLAAVSSARCCRRRWLICWLCASCGSLVLLCCVKPTFRIPHE